MSTTNDKVKEIVFEYIDSVGKENIRTILSTTHGEAFLRKASDACLSKVASLGMQNSKSTALAALLHFTLSLSAVSSHRKVDYDGTELDIVIPNIRTLRITPESALVICILTENDIDAQAKVDKIASLVGTQPKIMLVMIPSANNMKYDTYSVDDHTFENIIKDARVFLETSNNNTLRIVS